MPGILLNLLAATTGGQVTRAEAFLLRFHTYAPGVRLVIVKERSALPFIDEIPNWSVHNVDIGANRLKALHRAVWENLNLPKLMISEGLDTYLTFSHYLPLFLPKNVFSIVGVSNLEPFSEMAWEVESNATRLRLMLLRQTIITSSNRADQVIALSHACKNILVQCGVNKSKIKVIPNGVDICKDHEDDDIEISLPCKSPYILTVSHFYRYKNFEKLIEALGLLSFNLKDQMQYKLIIVGKPYDKKYYDEIIDLITKLELQDHIIIIPGLERKSLDTLYRNAAIFVFTSLIENSPNILLEAMAHSLPIVSSDVAPMPEFGGDSVSYFNALSASDLAEKLSDVMEDTERATKMRILAKQRSMEYSWDKFTKSVIDICSTSSQYKVNNPQEPDDSS